MHKGWLKIPGIQDGERSLAEQMKGLEPALSTCSGKTIYDFGCAEGLIAIEFGKRGATRVRGCDFVAGMVNIANREADAVGLGITCQFYRYDLIDFSGPGIPGNFPEEGAFDIVLALAIVHKLPDPGLALANMARVAAERLVLRLPIGSVGVIRHKHGPRHCDSRAVMPAAGFSLEQVCEGPRREVVQHWIRR